MTTLTWTGTVVVTKCWCGIGYGVPSSLYEEAKRNHKQVIYCPLGHEWVFSGETEAARLARQLKAANDRIAAKQAQVDQVEASLRATKGHVTRLRKQVLAGQCPFCGQHLRDLERHITRQHGDETPDAP